MFKVLAVILLLMTGAEENYWSRPSFDTYDACVEWMNSDFGQGALDQLAEYLDKTHGDGDDVWSGSADCVQVPTVSGAVTASVTEGNSFGYDEAPVDVWAGLPVLLDEMTRRGGFGHMDGK